MEETQLERIKNYNVSVKEVSNKVIFLRKLVPGGSEHSFGIHVAKMAGMPKSIVKRSNEILKQLETDNRQEGIDCKEKAKGKVKAKPVKEIAAAAEGFQLSFFQLDDPVLSQVVQDIRCFVHLYHKSRLTDRDIIGSSYTGKYLVYHTDTGRLSRHKTTYLRHQGN